MKTFPNKLELRIHTLNLLAFTEMEHILDEEEIAERLTTEAFEAAKEFGFDFEDEEHREYLLKATTPESLKYLIEQLEK